MIPEALSVFRQAVVGNGQVRNLHATYSDLLRKIPLYRTYADARAELVIPKAPIVFREAVVGDS